MIKPLYGLLSDFVPLGGYRRKSYLLLMNLVAAGAFCWTFGVRSPGMLMAALFAPGVGVACSDVVTDGLMVETGQRTGRVKLFQGVQWTCVSLASIAAALAGGYLCQVLPADRALPVAALIAAGTAAAVAVIAWLLVREPKAPLDLPQLKATAAGVAAAFTSVRLWLVLLYLALTQFNPGMETPLYVHLTATMGMSEAFYGQYSAFAAGGFAAGALLFTLVVAPRFSTRTCIVIGLVVFAVAMLAYAPLLRDHGPTVKVLGVGYGIGYMMSNLALLSLAAENCPRRAEGFTFAAMMSVLNFANQGADWVGGRAYETILHKQFWPLPVASAAITLLAAALVPLLPRGNDARDAIP
jgi:MFS family permease